LRFCTRRALNGCSVACFELLHTVARLSLGTHECVRAHSRPCGLARVCVCVFVCVRLRGCARAHLRARPACVRVYVCGLALCVCVCTFACVRAAGISTVLGGYSWGTRWRTRAHGVYSGVRTGYSQKVRTCVFGCASFGGVWHITTGAHGTARELSANWLHRRGTRRVLTSAFCRAVHRCACVSAGTPTPTTVVPAVAPSGMSFFEYPRVPHCVPWGAPFTTSSIALRTMGLPLLRPRVPHCVPWGAPFTTSSIPHCIPLLSPA
jgi:hypothetical protein